jgi:hypothetical protein
MSSRGAEGDEESRSALKRCRSRACPTLFIRGRQAVPLQASKEGESFSWFLGARQRTGMSDCLENTQCEIRRFARNDSPDEVLTQTLKPRPSKVPRYDRDFRD